MNRGERCGRNDLLASYCLGALDRDDLRDLERHLEGCDSCREELARLRPVVEALSGTVEQLEPPPSLKAGLMAQVNADLAASGPVARDPGAAEVEAVDGTSGGTGEGHRSSRAGSRPRRWRLGLWRGGGFGGSRGGALAGVALASLIVGLAAGYLIGDGQRSPGLGGAGELVASTEDGSGMSAELFRAGDIGALRLSGMKAPPPGKVYQAWLRQGERVVPTDTLFVPGADGAVTTAISGMEGADAVMITAERRQGSERPTEEPRLVLEVAS